MGRGQRLWRRRRLRAAHAADRGLVRRERRAVSLRQLVRVATAAAGAAVSAAAAVAATTFAVTTTSATAVSSTAVATATFDFSVATAAVATAAVAFTATSAAVSTTAVASAAGGADRARWLLLALPPVWVSVRRQQHVLRLWRGTGADVQVGA